MIQDNKAIIVKYKESLVPTIDIENISGILSNGNAIIDNPRKIS
jgi:hypothetical protein